MAQEVLGATAMDRSSHHPSNSDDPIHVMDSSQAASGASDLVNSSTVASPGPIEDSDGDRHDDPSSRSFTYPLPTPSAAEDPRRGLSLPYSPSSPSAKKHRCPYCPTEFTRQHNLKSHLLTHSQEKPYVCPTCQARFRRSHDLKRHARLHTGERPHICDKCGRRFARGDALARHNKAQGGCAGRRTSMGSFAPDDEYADGVSTGGGPVQAGGDDGMDGLMFAEPERMDEDEERRLSVPGIRAHDGSMSSQFPHRSSTTSTTSIYPPRQPNTYPPIAANRPSPVALLPPTHSHGGSSALASPVSQSGNMTFPPAGQPSGSSIFPPSVSESPRALSPNSQQVPPLPPQQQPQRHSSSSSSSFSRTNSLVPPQAPIHSQLGLAPPPPPAPREPSAPQLLPRPGLSSSSESSRLLALPQSMTKQGPTRSLSRSRTPTLEGPQNQDEDVWTHIRSLRAEVDALRAEVHMLRAQGASNG